MASRIKYHNPHAGIRVISRADADEIKRERDCFYGSARWRKLRALYLTKHPLCAKCQAQGDTKLASVVHHKQERLDFPALAYSWDNLEGLCASCHTGDHKRKR